MQISSFKVFLGSHQDQFLQPKVPTTVLCPAFQVFQGLTRVPDPGFLDFVRSHQGPGSRFFGFSRVRLGSQVPVFRFFLAPGPGFQVVVGCHQGFTRVPDPDFPFFLGKGPGSRFSGFSRVPDPGLLVSQGKTIKSSKVSRNYFLKITGQKATLKNKITFFLKSYNVSLKVH